MENKGLSQGTLWLSVVAVVLAALDAFGVSVWLAASTWLLVAAVMGVWSLAFKPAK